MSARGINRLLAGTTIAAGLLLAGFLGWFIRAELGVQRSGAAKAPVIGRAPVYRDLINQLGQPVSSSQFKGKIRVVTFLFPYCTTYCPLTAAHLVGFENLLRTAGLQNRVQIVAFDVDPAGTGPGQMRAFLKEYGWDPKDLHWQYLTGAPKAIRHVVTGGYHIAYTKTSDDDGDQPRGPEETPQPTVVNPLARKAHVDYDITHNDALVIVDARGRIRKVYDQADTVSGQQLLAAIHPLLHDAPH